MPDDIGSVIGTFSFFAHLLAVFCNGMGNDQRAADRIVRILHHLITAEIHGNTRIIRRFRNRAVLMQPVFTDAYIDQVCFVNVVNIEFQEAVILGMVINIQIIAQGIRNAAIDQVIQFIIFADMPPVFDTVIAPYIFCFKTRTLVIPGPAVVVLDRTWQILFVGILYDIDHAFIYIIIVDCSDTAFTDDDRFIINMHIAVIAVIILILSLLICVYIHADHFRSSSGPAAVDVKNVFHIHHRRNGIAGRINNKFGNFNGFHAGFITGKRTQSKVHAAAHFNVTRHDNPATHPISPVPSDRGALIRGIPVVKGL